MGRVGGSLHTYLDVYMPPVSEHLFGDYVFTHSKGKEMHGVRCISKNKHGTSICVFEELCYTVTKPFERVVSEVRPQYQQCQYKLYS